MPSHRITETELFRRLKKQELMDGFEAGEISSRVNAVAEEVSPLLQQVCRAFPLYTLHDPEHSFRVAENIGRLIPQGTFARLNSIELSILLYAAYLHDLGMSSSQDALYAWLKSNEYDVFMATHDDWASAIRRHPNVETSEAQKTDPQAELILRQIQDVAYTEYLRQRHSERSAELIVRQFGPDGLSDNKIRVQEVNWADYVALVCKSHGGPATALKGDEFRRDAHVGKLPVNLQYCAVLLRLADLADLDPERTPKVLLDFIMADLRRHPAEGGPIVAARARSAEEWAKHRAVLGYKISSEEIRIEARCTHPAIQRGLYEWCDYIDSERRDCRLIVQDNRKEITETYSLDLTNEVRRDFIRSDGSYIYADFQFQLDYDRIVRLLMGTALWGDPTVVCRELLQNAIDACRHRQALSARLGLAYEPRIRFAMRHNWEIDERHMVLTCEDNGCGMDQHIVENFLMRIGRSYYSSPEFRQQNLGFNPISQFGLGVMSYFMLADSLNIHTQRFYPSGEKSAALAVEVNSAGRYVVLRPDCEDRDGTAVVLTMDAHARRHEWDQHMHSRLHHPMMIWDMLPEVLHTIAIHVDIPIEISRGLDESSARGAVITPGPFKIPAIEADTIPCIEDRYREFTFRFTYEQTKGLAGLFRFLIPEDAKGSLCWVCPVESLFKMFIDADGDLCLTSPSHTSDKVNLNVTLPEEWDSEELRGVYRHMYRRKPPGSSYDGKPFEIVKAQWRWSQNGLLVGPIVTPWDGRHHRSRREDADDDQEGGKSDNPADLFSYVPVPGLNAADIDLRGQWQLPLNVQRTEFQRGPLFAAFCERYMSLAAEMWEEILKQAGMRDDLAHHETFVRGLLERSNWELRTLLKQRGIDVQPNSP